MEKIANGSGKQQQKELWVLLYDDENDKVWQRVYAEFGFSPSVSDSRPSFIFHIPVDIYDISHSPIWNDDKEINRVIESSFISCMGSDDYMYALNWQHSCFRYNPRNKQAKENPAFIADERYFGGGYNAYFPTFYPNGDYHFFIAKDFSWGYLGHPWLKKVFVFGSNLMALISSNSDNLGFQRCS